MGETLNKGRRPVDTDPTSDQFRRDTEWMDDKLDQLTMGQLREGSTFLSSFLTDTTPRFDPDRPKTIGEHLDQSAIDIYDRAITEEDFPVIQEITSLRHELQLEARHNRNSTDKLASPTLPTRRQGKHVRPSVKNMILSLIPGTPQSKL